MMGLMSVQRGLGCAAVFPAAIIGLAGLMDGIGPVGWRGFAELFGWLWVCLGAAALLGSLLTRAGKIGGGRYVLAVAAMACLGVLGYQLMSWLGLDGPISAKILFTRSMQVIGSAGTGLLVLWIAFFVWAERQKH